MPNCPTCGKKVGDTVDFGPYCGGLTRPCRKVLEEGIKKTEYW